MVFWVVEMMFESVAKVLLDVAMVFRVVAKW